LSLALKKDFSALSNPNYLAKSLQMSSQDLATLLGDVFLRSFCKIYPKLFFSSSYQRLDQGDRHITGWAFCRNDMLPETERKHDFSRFLSSCYSGKSRRDCGHNNNCLGRTVIRRNLRIQRILAYFWICPEKKTETPYSCTRPLSKIRSEQYCSLNSAA
jgi:hypothetical protein